MSFKASTLRNKGYLPLPVEPGEKGCFLTDWPNREWEGTADNLGLNLVGLVMVDFDLDLPLPDEGAPDIVMELAAYVSQTAPVRIRRNSTRAALLLRCPELEEQKYFRRTSKWRQGHVEIKGGRGKFMFGWGTHPSGAVLHWDFDGSDYADPKKFPEKRHLPAITKTEVEALIPYFEETLGNYFGGRLEPPGGVGFSAGGFTRHFDIMPEMEFSTNDGDRYTVEDLRNMVQGSSTRVFVNLTPWRAGSNSMAGLVGWSPEHNGLRVTDLVEGVVHYEHIDIETVDLAEFGIEPLVPPPSVNGAGGESELTDEELEAQASRYVFVEALSAYVWRHDPQSVPRTKSALFSNLEPKERIQVIRRIEAVDRQVWDPRRPSLSIFYNEAMGWKEHNVFYLPNWPEQGGDVTPFLRFMELLFPDPEMRHDMFCWMAAKAQRPWERGYSVCLIGPPGSGKTTLWTVLQALWTPQNVAMQNTMTGALQLPYQDFLYRRVYTFFDEVTSEDAGVHLDARRRAANALKAFADTTSATKKLNIKGKPMEDTLIATTIGVGANDRGGLPLEPNDRRFAVIPTGRPLVHNLMPTWIRKPANLGKLWSYLLAFPLGGFDFMTPPFTEAKAEMIEINKTDVEELVEDYVALANKHSHGLTTRAQWEWYLSILVVPSKKRTVANRLWKRAFPHTGVFGNAEYKTFRCRATNTDFQDESASKIAAAVQALSEALSRRYDTAENPPFLSRN